MRKWEMVARIGGKGRERGNEGGGRKAGGRTKKSGKERGSVR